MGGISSSRWCAATSSRLPTELCIYRTYEEPFGRQYISTGSYSNLVYVLLFVTVHIAQPEQLSAQVLPKGRNDLYELYSEARWDNRILLAKDLKTEFDMNRVTEEWLSYAVTSVSIPLSLGTSNLVLGPSCQSAPGKMYTVTP